MKQPRTSRAQRTAFPLFVVLAGATGPAACGEPASSLREPACVAPVSGEARDLLPVARLRSQGTAAEILIWTREDHDEIATIRDDAPETGWLPSREGEASVEIDLGPAGGPFALRSLTLVWDMAPPNVEVLTRDACGGDLIRRDAWRGGELKLDDVCSACVELRVRDAAGARLLSISLTSASPDVPDVPPLPPGTGVQSPLPRIGVVEGFYGQPWTWSERAKIVDALGRSGLGLYIYAPKDDPLHRAEWRTFYDETFIAEFAHLARVADERNVRIAIALSPFIDFDATAGDHERLVSKLRPFVEQGIRSIAVFADDIEFETERPIDGALGALHATEVNALTTELRSIQPALDVYFVGTVYSDARLVQSSDASAYLEALGALEPSVAVFWTGSDTFAPAIDRPSLTVSSTAIGRTVGVWDNHWANDAGNDLLGRILLAPLSGREQGLVSVVPALVENPSIQGSVARLQVGMLGAWATTMTSSPQEQRAAAATQESTLVAFPREDMTAADRADLLVRIMELFELSGITETDGDVALEAALDHLATALLAGGAVEPSLVDEALRLTARAHTARSELERSNVSTDLMDDLSGPLTKVEAAGALLLDALERASMARAGEETTALDYALLDGPVTLDALSRFRFLDETIADFVEVSRATQPDSLGGRPAHGEAPPACVVGRRFQWRPFTGVARLEVFGLPDAKVSSELVSFSPRVAGRHEVVAVALPEAPTAGWSSRRASVVCHPPGRN